MWRKYDINANRQVRLDRSNRALGKGFVDAFHPQAVASLPTWGGGIGAKLEVVSFFCREGSWGSYPFEFFFSIKLPLSPLVANSILHSLCCFF